MPQSYPLPLPNYRLTISEVNRTAYLLSRSLRINQILGSQVDTCGFSLRQPANWRSSISSIKPDVGEEVTVELSEGSGSFAKIFAGYITGVVEVKDATAGVRWNIEATDYTQILARRYVVGIAGSAAQGGTLLTSTGAVAGTPTEIIRAIIAEYAPQISTGLATVETNTTEIASISFNYELVRDAIDRVAKLVQWEWYIDYDKALHFFAPTGAGRVSPNQITDTSLNFDQLSINPQLDQVRNRIWVQGGQSISDEVFETFDANGIDRFWELHNTDIEKISMTIDGVAKTIGIQGGRLPEQDFDFLLVQTGAVGNTAVVRNSGQMATVEDLAKIVFRYKYKYPIALMVEDTASQAMVAALAAHYPDTILADSPARYYRLGESSGTTAVDETGNGNGTYSGSPTLGIAGALIGDANTAVSFDGTNDMVTIPHAADLSIGTPIIQEWAVELWVKMDLGAIDGPLLAKSTTEEWAVKWVGGSQRQVRFRSSSYTVNNPFLNLDNTNDNSTGVTLMTDGWHHVLFTYDGTYFRSFCDGVLRVQFQSTLVLGSNTDVLRMASQDGLFTFQPCRLDEVAIYSGISLDIRTVRAHWVAGREDGVRESAISSNRSLQSLSEARSLGNLELARWSDVITEVRFSSFVSGWQIGDSVTINVTEANAGRTYSGTAMIQAVRITSLGAQRPRYDIECRSARFNLIDYFRQLLRIGPIGPDGQPEDLNLIRLIDDSNQMILIDGLPTHEILGVQFYVAPDFGAGTTPYIKCDYWVTDPGNPDG